jgi:hypothetical protein
MCRPAEASWLLRQPMKFSAWTCGGIRLGPAAPRVARYSRGKKQGGRSFRPYPLVSIAVAQLQLLPLTTSGPTLTATRPALPATLSLPLASAWALTASATLTPLPTTLLAAAPLLPAAPLLAATLTTLATLLTATASLLPT